MAKYSIEDTTLTNIADGIRSEADVYGVNLGKMSPEIMPMFLADVCNRREEKGYENGKKEQYDKFWDSFQENGNRTNYANAFAWGWDDVNFKPKHGIVPVDATNMFYKCKITDLKGILERQRVDLDFSKCTSPWSMFQFSKITKVGVINITSSTVDQSFVGENYSLTDVDLVVLKEDGSQPCTKLFGNAYALQNIAIDGKIGTNTHFSQSANLTRESLLGKIATEEQIDEGKNLININGVYYYGGVFAALMDYSGTNETRTLTLHKNAKARLSDSDIAIATQKGWTIA